MSALISIDRAKSAIARTTWPASEIDRVATLIGVVSRACELYCRRRFARATHDQVLTIKGNPLWLPNPPVHAVISVNHWPTEQPVPFDPVLPAGWLRLRTNWSGWDGESDQPGMVRVVYDAGFDPIPEDIQEAVALWTAASYWQTRQDPSLASKEPPPAAASLLAPYRRTILC